LSSRRHGVHVRLGRIEIDDQRANLGAQEMVRAAGAERAKRRRLLGIDEFEHGVLIVEVAELALRLADAAADFRHQAAAMARRSGAGRLCVTAPPKIVLPSVFSANQTMALLMMSSVSS
jgi:hypothetical protein